MGEWMSDPDGSAPQNGVFDGGVEVEDYPGLVGHEVRTPMAVIAMAAQTLIDHDADLPEGARLDLAVAILRNASRVTALLDRLQVAEEGAGGVFDVIPEVFDLVRFTRETIADIEEVVLKDHPTVVWAQSPHEVMADTNAVGEILVNLLTNAAKFSALGAPIDIHIREQHGVVELLVRDHGAGIDPDVATRVFDPYVRASELAKGMGLGLFVSRALARSSGGDLVLRVNGDLGCTFVLQLPQEIDGRRTS